MKGFISISRWPVLFSAILITNILCAQENFLPGKIILLNGDTIDGRIDYRNWDLNPNSITFNQSNSRDTIYNPLNIKSFLVADEIYVGGIFKVNNSPTNIEALSDSGGFAFRTDTVFLQAMFLGDKPLYYYKDKQKINHFFISANDEFQELLYKRYTRMKDGAQYVQENKRYIGQLSLYLSDCKNIQSKLSNLSYQRTPLFNLFNYYYKCSGGSSKYEKEVEKMKVETGALAGISITKLKFESTDPYFNSFNIDYPASLNVSGGIFCNLVLARKNEKWSIYNDLIYTQFFTSGTYIKYENDTWLGDVYTEIGFSYIKLNTLIRYYIPVNATRVFINAGISNGWAISSTNYLIARRDYYGTIISEERKALEESRNYEQGLIFGLGGRFKKYQLEGRMEFGNGISNYANLSSSTTRIYFLFGYYF